MTEYCRHNDIAHDVCGKLVVATRDDQLPWLSEMLERGRANGLRGLRRLTLEEAREIEPHVSCVAAIHVPEEGIADYAGVAAAMARDIRAAGGEVHTGARVKGLVRERGATGSSKPGAAPTWRIITPESEHTAGVIVNCAGLHVDRIARMAGERPESRIVAFRGEYHRLREPRAHLVRHLIYPLPEPGFPFLGVHLTRRIDGSIDAGPNAVLAFAREGYRFRDVNLHDLAESLRFPGLWRFIRRHPRMVRREIHQSLSSRYFLKALQRLVPELRAEDMEPAEAGVRAQAMSPAGELIQDFQWIVRPGAVHVVNAPSPAATASLAIGKEIAARAAEALRA